MTPVDFTQDMSPDLPEVWKIFSQKPLTQKDLDDIFEHREETVVADWLAYPQYR